MKKEVLAHAHGGDLDAIERRYGIPKSEIWDFSGNINPYGFPKKVKTLLADNLDLVTTYPDKKYLALKESIGNYTNAQRENIVVGNGSTELISNFIKCVNPKKAIIMGPAYSEYEHSLKVSNSDFEYFELREDEDFCLNLPRLMDTLTEKIDFFVACNPNNPTGSAITCESMRILLTHCKNKSIAVMIDETYIEFSNNLNEICSIPLVEEFDNLFVIRGVSKFFAAPGIRLGYGITSNKDFHTLIGKTQDPWSVNSLAAFVGENLFKDSDFINATHTLVASEREKAILELKKWKNVKVYNSSSNFVLFKILTDKTTAGEIFEHLIPEKMLVRDASSFTFLDDSFLRFCILNPEQNEKLLDKLKEIIE